MQWLRINDYRYASAAAHPSTGISVYCLKRRITFRLIHDNVKRVLICRYFSYNSRPLLLSFLCAGLMMFGMFFNNLIYWFIVDIIVILFCVFNGTIIIKRGFNKS